MDSIFPKHVLDNDINKCIRSIAELDNMAGDRYEREYLAPFYEWALYHVIAWWIDVTENGELYEVPREKAISKDGFDLFCTINNVDNYFDFMFEDWDILHIERNIDVKTKIDYYSRFSVCGENDSNTETFYFL